MKKIIQIIAVLGLVAVAGYVYVTRPPALPSEDVGAGAETLTPADELLFRISQTDSRVRFKVNEVLRNNPYTAVGETSQVAGDIAITASPAEVRVGELRINARTLKTDSTSRDGMISRFILASEDPANEFIVFQPTSVADLPAVIAPGSGFAFTLSGDMTIKGVTKPVTFTVAITELSAERLAGSATATVSRADFGITIPSVPSVASVEDKVILEAEIVAELVQ